MLLKPNKSLSKEDFAGLSASVDTYLADYASIHGVLIHAEAFPGWESFAGFTAHIRFVRNHHQKIERVALVTDSPVARVAEALAKHFTAAEIKHFPFADYEKALSWLKDLLKRTRCRWCRITLDRAANRLHESSRRDRSRGEILTPPRWAMIAGWCGDIHK